MEHKTIRVGNTCYPILKTLARGRVERHQVGDPDRTFGGPAFQVIVLPRAEASWRHIKTLQRISRSNENLPMVVRCHPSRDRIYLVTIWVEGQDLLHVLDRLRRKDGKGPSVHQTCRLARGLAHGLHHINDLCSLVHGDIAPWNLIVTQKMRKLVLVDFGSAWEIERTARRDEGDGHSRGYAAPEMSGGPDVLDFRADQFSLSCVAYKMLTDRLPYDGLGGLAGTDRYRDADIELIPPSKCAVHRKRFSNRVWSRIDAVACRGLALSPNDRYLGTGPWIEDWDSVVLAIERPDLANPLEMASHVVRSLFGRTRTSHDL